MLHKYSQLGNAMKKGLIVMVCFLLTSLLSAETRLFYEKNYDSSRNEREGMLIEHASGSYYDALDKKAKFTSNQFLSHIVPMNYLLNNLCNLKEASHLHIGLDKGMSFVCALFGNEALLSEVIGIDSYVESPAAKLNCYMFCDKHLEGKDYQILISDCFSVEKSIFKKPVDIYFYDADHSLIAQELAFTYYNDILADVFIAVVDDWGWDRVREGTFTAFDQLGYTILYETIIPPGDGNGQYLAVIRK